MISLRELVRRLPRSSAAIQLSLSVAAAIMLVIRATYPPAAFRPHARHHGARSQQGYVPLCAT